ncbi:MAG: hypothetical protein R2800_08830 [Flavipsychrobacter sp.]
MYKLPIGILFMLTSFISLAQEQTTSLSNKQQRKLRPKYMQVGMGFNRGAVQDFATSPITYKGLLFNYSLARLNMDSKKEVKAGVRFNHGKYGYSREEGIPVATNASAYLLFLNYYSLYRINRWSNDKWNIKLGGAFDVVGDLRINSAFMNAAVGFEVFNTLALSGKATRVFRRDHAVDKKLWFIKYQLKPTVRTLSYRFNVPVVNGYYRNGYAYVREGSLTAGYQYKLFSGVRLNSELAYTHQMQNGNMWRASYFWDAYTTGGDHNRFEMANHIFEFSILFHLNKTVQP